MKKYLLGLGAMLIGAGLMFACTHTEVRAESKYKEADCQMFTEGYQYCQIKNLTCVKYDSFRKIGLSCVKAY